MGEQRQLVVLASEPQAHSQLDVGQVNADNHMTKRRADSLFDLGAPGDILEVIHFARPPTCARPPVLQGYRHSASLSDPNERLCPRLLQC